MKKLYRSKKNRILTGILGGLGEYTNVDPTVVRIIFMVLLIPFLPLVLVYFISTFIIPEESS
ncbi:phage shock protein C (PspC) family protein [Scopulibacillus darangshiensis]|uniref:Phage shock protein C (PspC) family protein n=1 Tax=Scopulibacillus darangshiensis TaxID=442528 RepID=A0A4R2NSF3_9BACL|nr:PspC domain-containing protein [Scopulibacillus darangshiensis]TCP24889.1 phage shock protein C (PspC) family protein [Scopulibacillus darangshiensis]